MTKPRLAITLGDPAGIGCEIVHRAVNSLSVKRVCSPVVFGDASFASNFKNIEFIASSNINSSIKIGIPSKKAGIVATSAIYEAVKFCTSNKTLALVTAPISKQSLKMASVKYTGHTELLAALTKSRKVAMMMVCGNIHSVMVSRHIPVSQISENIKTKNIIETVNLSINFLKKIGKKNIKTVLCGLNPHAGDNSILGFEEKIFLLPAYKILKKSGIDITKPLPADSAWLKTKNGQYDLICAMYHDQVMIALKCIDAAKIVNVTVGLPFIRTSPGHGTAFDIAGKNKADASAMIEAILYASSSVTAS
ncbi:MAG: 4-hydroxythreonine-4-phosphate dehydrogenase PdxA [Endomicrobium sp.]|jgi:4-hydroxythreonine-4-phosphate dehydrogenase|nr:4-hydroxythreonine-4-phosphate dehydrogenase PdxA [Endomicrobium sp.]